MRILFIHADSFDYRVTEKTSVAGALGDIDEKMEKGAAEEVLVAFMASEKTDEDDVESVAEKTAALLKEKAEQLKAKTVMLYPYAHLSSELSSPRVAVDVLGRIYKKLSEVTEIEIMQAPFGYYKAFNISCKGHPLSETAQTVLPGKRGEKAQEAGVSAALQSEKKLESEWLVCMPNGEIVEAEKADMKKYPDFRKMYEYELHGTRQLEEPPPHIEMMRRLEMVDYEPGSDAGNFRWYPKGQLVKSLLESYVSDMVVEYGGMQVETPVMYDFQHPLLSSYLNRFPARQYIVKSDKKEYFLRFAACFGQYLIQHDMTMSYNHMPLRLYELTHYSFRREQSGELAGLKRLRTFTMPDLHTLTTDMEQAKQEFVNQVKLAQKCVKGFEVDGQVAVRFVRDVYEKNLPFVKEIAAISQKPILLELWDERFFYFVAKYELNFIDAHDKTSCLSTVQIDVENTERFDITYVDKEGQRKHPLLMHTSVSGSIDRVLYAMLESQALNMKKGKKPELPFWISPVQVRLIPVSDRFVQFAEQLLQKIPYRCDLDDREETVRRRIRDAEKEWIPYILVLGEKEVSGDMLNIRCRREGSKNMNLQHFIELLDSRQQNYPWKRLNLPAKLSKRPIFVG